MDVERREKLLLATLVYAFLLPTRSCARSVRQWLLRHWGQRRVKRSRETQAPLYRLRSALSRLWQEHHPHAMLPAPCE